MDSDSQKEETSYVCLMESKGGQEKGREVTQLRLTLVVTTIRIWAAESATKAKLFENVLDGKSFIRT